jgi:hypothetical protein
MTTVTESPQRTVTLHTVEPPGSESRAISARLCSVQGPAHTLEVESPEAVQALAVQGLEMTWESEEGTMSVPVRLRETDGPARRVTVEIAERRSHLRVDSSLFFRHRPLSEAEFNDLIPRVISQPLEYLEDAVEADVVSGDENWERLETVFSNFHRMLREIADQVDRLIAVQEGRSVTAPHDRTSIVVNISGAGIAFEASEIYALGTKLRMVFDLSRYPYRSILCLGEVVRVDSRPSPPPGVAPHLIYVGFTHIREEDRDRIIHYVFKMQRRMLRRRAMSS